MSHFFECSNCIGVSFRMLSEIHQNFKKFVGIGEVKIPGKYQISWFPVILAHYGVYKIEAVFTECPVT